MKLEVGMYVRTKDGCICKILKETYSKYLSKNKELCYEVDRSINVNMELYNEDVLKVSNSILDLIEVGDYVNGLPVCINYWKSDNKWHLEIPDSRFISKIPLEQVNIQSIVTKEQFESMQYEVK